MADPVAPRTETHESGTKDPTSSRVLKSLMSRLEDGLRPSGAQVRGGLVVLTFTVLAPVIIVGTWAPIEGDARIDFFTAATGVTTGLLIADVLAASAVVRAFEGHRFNWVDRLQLVVLVALPPVLLGVSLLRLLVSIANCVPAGARQVCRSPSANPNSLLAALASGLCLLVGQYVIALIARRKA